MSNYVASAIRRRNLDLGLTGKSVLLLMADFASDDGSGIWASKATMALELETTIKTIQRTIKKLIELGLVQETGVRKHRNGETYEYKIDMDQVRKRPLVRPEPPSQCRPSTQDVDGETQDIAPVTVSPLSQCRPTPDTLSPHGATECRPNQINQKEPARATLQKPKARKELLAFYAEAVCKKSVTAPKMITLSMGQALLAEKMVTLEQLRAAGVDT